MVEYLGSKKITLSKVIAAFSSSNSVVIDEKFSAFKEIVESQDYLNTNHIWLSSSGSHNRKLLALSTESLIESAEAVNSWLQVTREDTWAIALPLNHVAGLSIVARSIAGNFKPIHFVESWNPFKFCNFIARERATLSSLVPTQLFDLVTRDLNPPPTLRAVVIGGAALDRSLYHKARRLNWPIIPSYGLSECCSQVATASLKSLSSAEEFPDLFVLPIWQCRVDQDRALELKGKALFSAHISQTEGGNLDLITIERGSFFRTSDLADLELAETSVKIKIIGRSDRQVKIKGWLVSLDQVSQMIQVFFDSRGLQQLFAITSSKSLRDGYELILHISVGLSVGTLLLELNSFLEQQDSRMPKIVKIVDHPYFPLLANGKIDYNSLKIDQQ